jgi:ADP-ribosylglycohydrolase
MLGAIAGDVIGSVYEARPIKTTDFPLFDEACRFTDDTVLTVAVADCLLHGRTYVDAFHEYWRTYPHAGFGGSFTHWALSKNLKPYNSWGNGSAMRVSPVAYACDRMSEVLAEAERSASITHSHEEGIRGAQATAAAVFLARQGEDKVKIREYVESHFGYDLHRTLDQLRPDYQFDVSCQGSVPESIISFLESDDFESSLRNAISLGGDADTMACIAGAIAEPFYGGVPQSIARRVVKRLDDSLRKVLDEFTSRYIDRRDD